MTDAELFKLYRETGDKKIRNQIVEKYMYVADIVAKKFSGRGVDLDDLKQVASLALIKGIDRFDETLGMQFSTFITPTIAGEIKNYFRDKSRPVKLPRRIAELSGRVKTFINAYETEHGEKPTVKQIAKELSLTEEEVVASLETSYTVSLDTMASKEDDDGQTGLYSLLPSVEGGFEKFEMKDALEGALYTLGETERALIKYRFIDGLSQSETAKKLGVSQMFVSRMERKVLGKLREKLKDSV